jgi:hypothetical protein
MIDTELLCTKCLQIKSVENFYPKRDATRVRQHQSRCKDCARANTAKHRSENNVKAREQDRKHYHKNPQKKILSVLKSRSKNREKFALYQKSWRLLNPDKTSASSRMRDTKRIQRVPLWLSETQKKEIENFYWLAKDLKKVTGENYHVDHIVPLLGKSVCGLHVPWNLQVLPADINMKKSNFFEGGQ